MPVGGTTHVSIASGSDNDILDNAFVGAGWSYPVLFTGSDRNRVRGNTFQGTGPIVIWGSTANEIVHNTLR